MNTLMNDTTPTYDQLLASPSQKHELGFLIGMLAIFMGILALYFGVFYFTSSSLDSPQNAERLEAQV